MGVALLARASATRIPASSKVSSPRSPMASNMRSTGTGKYGAATKPATSSAVGTP